MLFSGPFRGYGLAPAPQNLFHQPGAQSGTDSHRVWRSETISDLPHPS